MTGMEIAAIITSISSLVAAIGSAGAVLMSARNGRKIEEVKAATNGMKDQLIKATGEARYAEGVRFGEEEERRNGHHKEK